MLTPKQIDQQLTRLQTYRRTLAHLLNQAAQYGGESFAPANVANGIDEAREQIRRIKTTLRANNVDVADHPDDQPGIPAEQGQPRIEEPATLEPAAVPRKPLSSAKPWKPWGDHPLIVSAMLILALISVLIGIVALIADRKLPSEISTIGLPQPTIAERSPVAFLVPGPTPTPEPLKIQSIAFYPPPPAAPDQVTIYACTSGLGGVGVTLKVSVNTAPDGTDKGQWKILKELGVPCFNQVDAPTWDTKGWKAGTYLVKVKARGSDDPEWKNEIVATTTYTITR